VRPRRRRLRPVTAPTAWPWTRTPPGTPRPRRATSPTSSSASRPRPAAGARTRTAPAPLRLRGQPWAADNNSKYLSENDFDAARDPKWGYVGTLDNNATFTELRFLAKVAAQAPGKDGDAYRQSFLKGVRYLLAAQFPNGGWPQVWPLEGGYHDAVTFNDNAVSEAADLLTEVSEAKADFAFVPADLRAKAGVAAKNGREVIVASQIRVNGKLTIWGQQADAVHPGPGRRPQLRAAGPVDGRERRPAGLSDEPARPDPAEVAAVHAGVAWMKSAAIMGKAWTGGKGDPEGRRLVDQPGAGPLWSRYYDTAGKPVFGERDKTLRDNANELSLERRNGYAWFGTGPAKALKTYETWAKSHPAA
jgi:PelA/Pel-15E family pectate lyase